MSSAHADTDRIAQLDPQRLAAFKALGNPQLFGKVIRSYIDHSPKLLHTLREAIAAGDAHAVQNAAHSLKSSSASVGATDLAVLSQQLELLGREHNIDDAARILAEIQAEYTVVQAALLQELQQSALDA